MTKIFCDKCGKEIRECDTVDISWNMPLTAMAYLSFGKDTEGSADLCHGCMMEFLNKIRGRTANEAGYDNEKVSEGQWVIGADGRYYCSRCQEHAVFDRFEDPLLSDYCPNCGARMEVSK